MNECIIIDSYFIAIPFLIEDLTEVVSHMWINKASQTNNIPPKMLKENFDICPYFLLTNVNNCILEAEFPDHLKLAEIFPSFKQGDRLLRNNYRPVSILLTISKIYEKMLYKQMYEYFNKTFSKYLCGFRKRYSTQHCLLFMLEKIKHALDKGLHAGILLTDLLKFIT